MKECFCGNERTPKFLNKVMSWVFNEACRLHDYFYGSMLDLFGDGYIGKVMSKILSDFFFLIHMGFLLIVMQVRFALGCLLFVPMFLGVLFGGWKSYKKIDTTDNKTENV